MEEILETLWSRIKKKKVFTLDNDGERLAYAIFMSNRVEKALYTLLVDEGATDLPWDEFYKYIGGSPEIKEAARAVIMEAITAFPRDSYFSFKDPNPILPEDEDDDPETIRGYVLFPGNQAVGWVDGFFFHAEVIFYIYQLNSGKSYSWEDYLDEMQNDPEMWHRLVMAFRDAVMRLDYAPYWRKYLDAIIEDLNGEGDYDE